MDKAHWEILSPLLDQLLDVEPGERVARLERIRAGDAALADELEALLVANAAADREHFLEGDVAGAIDGEPVDSSPPGRNNGHPGPGST